MRYLISGGRVLRPDGRFETADIAVDGDHLADADAGRLPLLDATGLLVLPGIIDIHGDAFERQLMPRPGVFFPLDVALADTDRQMLASGITTAYHGLTWTWEPGLRSDDRAEAFIDGFASLRGGLLCDTRLHLRFEVAHLDAVQAVAQRMRQGQVGLLSFNDHYEAMERHVSTNPDKLAGYLHRTGLDQAGFVALFRAVGGRRHDVPAVIRRLAALARELGIPTASHDDESPQYRQDYRELGCRICEFPADAATAKAAMDAGDHVILGAPNVLRGGSHIKRLSAAQAAAQGLCSALSSDYYYPALLLAPFLLASQGLTPFERAWELVSGGPARAMGLRDRGAVAPGKRADLVLVDAAAPERPRVVATIAAGRLAHYAGHPGRVLQQ